MSTLLQQHLSGFTRALLAIEDTQAVQALPPCNSGSKITPQLALAIYRNNTRGARINTLEQVYPACANILGSDTFRSIAKAYVVDDSVGTSDLNVYGETMANHFTGLLAAGRLPKDYRYLPDLARLEYALHAAMYADDDPVFDFNEFERQVHADEPLYLKTSHTLALLASEYPLYEIWRNNVSISDADDDGYNVKSIDSKQYLLVERKLFKPNVVMISEAEYRLLEAITRRYSLQSIIDNSGENGIACIDVLLPKCIAAGWIVGVEPGAR